MIWLNPTVRPRNAKKMIIARPISSGCLPVLMPTYVMVRPATTSIHRGRRCFAFISEYFHPIGKARDGHQAQICVKHQWVLPPPGLTPALSLTVSKKQVIHMHEELWISCPVSRAGSNGRRNTLPICSSDRVF